MECFIHDTGTMMLFPADKKEHAAVKAWEKTHPVKVCADERPIWFPYYKGSKEEE